MQVAIGSDHAGFALKQRLVEHLRGLGHEVDDVGTHSLESVDYPDYAHEVARRVAEGRADRGVLVCGTGQGMAMSANKVPGVRAVCVTDPYTAERAIASNNAQIITFGAQITGASVARMLLDIYLSNEFQGGRSAQKVAKLEALDQNR